MSRRTLERATGERATGDRAPKTVPPEVRAAAHAPTEARGPEAHRKVRAAGSPTALEPDQRREPRRRAEGVVVVRFGQPEREVRGRLVDISLSGFRIAHDCKTLETGQTVEFSHPEACGKARVVWNRIAVSGVETGLVLVAH